MTEYERYIRINENSPFYYVVGRDEEDGRLYQAVEIGQDRIAPPGWKYSESAPAHPSANFPAFMKLRWRGAWRPTRRRTLWFALNRTSRRQRRTTHQPSHHLLTRYVCFCTLYVQVQRYILVRLGIFRRLQIES